MKSPVWILILLLSSLIPATNTHAQQSDAAYAFLQEHLTVGEHKVEILGKEIPDDLKAIILKYRRAIIDSNVWYAKYETENKGQQLLPYHANFGITQPEYDRMNNDLYKSEMIVKAKKTLTIGKKDGKLTFTGEKPFSMYNAVVFDLETKTLTVDEDVTPCIGEYSEDESSDFGAWKGYRWKKEEGSMDEVKAGKLKDYYLMDIKIGKTASNKILMQIKAMLMENGNMMINSQVSSYLN